MSLPSFTTLRNTCRAGALAAALAAPLLSQAADLNVLVTNVPAGETTLYVALFDDAAAYDAGKAIASQTLPLRGADAQFAFMGLPPGNYALKVFADANGNGKLDANLLGLPIERYGFSRDAAGQRGAPGFDAAALRLVDEAAPLRTTIHLR
jgi:uncharacterized protein (DUF2141 family)